MTDVILRRYKETDTQFITREFNYCMWQVSRCCDLQAERIRMNWHSAAIFYQTQAALWYERAVECRARYERALAELIPGTSVRWDDIFTIRYIQFAGGGKRIGPNSILYLHDDAPTYSPDLEWNEILTLIPTQREVQRSQKLVIEPKPHKPFNWINTSPDLKPMFHNEQEALDNAALKLANSSAYGKWKTVPDPRPREHHYVSPKEKYDTPRDVPLTLEEISAQLKRWLS